MLDDRRLGKQRVECLQLVRAIRGETEGWKNHPAAVMWRPYVNSLISYGMEICEEWRYRGYQDTVWTSLYLLREDKPTQHPLWLGSEKLHASHRSNLLRKHSIHYGQFGWSETNDLPYFWPSPWYIARAE